MTHNQSEQRRAKRINTHIDDIKTMLQSCGYLGERTDKGTILENAARFISDHVDSAPGGGGAGAAIGAMRDAPSGTSGIDYVQVFQQSGVAQAIAGMDGSFVDCNRRFSELSGFTRDEVQRRSIFNMTPAEDLQHTFEIVSELMGPTSSSMGKPVEVRQFSKPCKMRGGIVAVDVSMALLRDSHGRPSQFACAVVPSEATKGPGACGTLAGLVGPPVDGEHDAKRIALTDSSRFDQVSGFAQMSSQGASAPARGSEGLFGPPSAPPRLVDVSTSSAYSPAMAMHGMPYRAHTPSGMPPGQDQAAGVDSIAAAAIASAGTASSSAATSLSMHPPQPHMGLPMHDLSARLGSRLPGSMGGGAFGRRTDVPVALALAQRARADRIRRAAAVASSAPGAPMSSMSSAAQAAILHDDAMRAAGFADDRSLLERSQEAEPGHDPRSVTQAELGSLSRPGYRRHGVPDESALSGLHMPALNGPASARARAYSASGMSDPIADHHHAMDGAGGLSLLSAASIHHEADMAGRGGQSSAMGAGRLPTGFTASSGQPAQGSAGGALSHGMIGAGALSVNSQSQNGNGMLGAGALSVLSDAPQAFLGDSRGDLSLVSDAVGDGLHEDAEGDGAGPNGRYSTSSSQLHH